MPLGNVVLLVTIVAIKPTDGSITVAIFLTRLDSPSSSFHSGGRKWESAGMRASHGLCQSPYTPLTFAENGPGALPLNVAEYGR
jgi:hypothetical protein